MKNYELVLRRVETELATGRLRLGGRLPSERALAEQLKISRPSVREAVRVLEAMGVVRTATGSGPDAGAVIVAEPAAPLTALLRLHLATNHLPMGDIVQTRVLLESWSARTAAALRLQSAAGTDGLADASPAGTDGVAGAGPVAAEGADSLGPDASTDTLGPDALREAEVLLDRMDVGELSPEEFHLLDAEFHVALSALSGNVLIAAVMSSLRSAIHGYVLAAVPNLPDWEATAATLRTEHRAIVAAIRAGDPDQAERLITDHIEGFYRAARLAAPFSGGQRGTTEAGDGDGADDQVQGREDEFGADPDAADQRAAQ